MYKASQQAGVVLDTLSKMHIKSPVIVGHSWAGSVVLAALLAEHDSVKPVATMGCFSDGNIYRPLAESRLHRR